MMPSFLSNEIVKALAWTLVHSIWQITLIAILLSVILRFANNISSIKKYYISVFGLALAIVGAIITFISYYGEVYTTNAILETSIRYQAHVSAMESSSYWFPIDFNNINNYVLAIVNAWLIGSALFFIKFLGGYLYLKGIVKNAVLENIKLQEVFKRLNKKYSIHRHIEILESFHINTPMVIGYLKPVILFPMGLVNQLSTNEIEAILAHELAHIKRHDYIVNIFQIITETIFLFPSWHMVHYF